MKIHEVALGLIITISFMAGMAFYSLVRKPKVATRNIYMAPGDSVVEWPTTGPGTTTITKDEVTYYFKNETEGWVAIEVLKCDCGGVFKEIWTYADNGIWITGRCDKCGKLETDNTIQWNVVGDPPLVSPEIQKARDDLREKILKEEQ